MTDQIETKAQQAADLLNANDIVYSMEFVVKLARKLVKAHPEHSPEQIAGAIHAAFNEALAKAEKRLEKVEDIRHNYNVLRSAQPVVAESVELIRRLAQEEQHDFAAEFIAKGKQVKPKPASKKAVNSAQTNLSL